MTDQVILIALDALVEPMQTERGDWADVLRRVEPDARPNALRRRAMLRRRRVAVALVAMALLLIVFATPAFGIRQAVLDLFERSEVEFNGAEEAPPAIREQFDQLEIGAPIGMNPAPMTNQTRLVGKFKIGGVLRNLYVVPAKHAGFCFEYESGTGGCMRTSPGFLPPVALTISAKDRQPDKSLKVWHVSGAVLQDEIRSLKIEFADGTTAPIPFVYVSSPIDAGFFAFDIPAGHQLQSVGPRAVIAFDSSGHELDREVIRWPFVE